MKRRTLTLAALVFGLGITLASCSYRGECTCKFGSVEVSDVFDLDNKEDYNDAKNTCENAGCDWKAKL